MDGEGHHHHHHPRMFELSPLLVGIIGIFSGAIIIITFHFIITCTRRRSRTTANNQIDNSSSQRTLSNISAASSTASMTRLITVYRSGIVSEDKQQPRGLEEEMECVICLSQILDGEEVRVMGECGHTFHVACIDMWLCSHPNCPVCRAQVAAAVRDAETERRPVVVYVPVSS